MASEGRGGRDKRHSEYGGGEGTFQPLAYPGKSDSGGVGGQGGPELTARESARLLRLAGGRGGGGVAMPSVPDLDGVEQDRAYREYLNARSDSRAGDLGETGAE